MPRRIFGHKREEAKGRETLHSEELYNPYYSPDNR
jgi:hypothetical protein